MTAVNFNVGFITGLSRIDSPFVCEIKFVTNVRSGDRVIKDSLIRSIDREYISKYEGCFSGRNAE
jgi:hypothetical protein